MKTTFSAFLLPIAFFWLESAVAGDSLRLVSARHPAFESPDGGNGDSYVESVSPDGRFVLFASTAVNLVEVKTNQPMPSVFPAVMNVFLRDRLQGTTTLVSVNAGADGGGDAGSVPATISTNGRYALFESDASNLVPNDANTASDVFIRDLANNRTIIVSVSTNGAPANGPSRSPVMSADGRYVAFASEADNLVPGDTNRITDIFVRDTISGVTTLVSVGAKAVDGTNFTSSASEAPLITPDGRYVAFYSTATDLYPGVPPGSGFLIYGDVYVRDLVAGQTMWASAGARAALLSEMGATNGFSFSPRISDDGQFIAYEAAPASASSALLLRYSLATGTTQLIHTNVAIYAGDYLAVQNMAQTPDGRFLVFAAYTEDITSYTTSILVWDAATGTLEVASVDLDNLNSEDSFCDSPAIDASGRYVAFLSDALTLVTNEVYGEFHLYLRDRQTDTTKLIDADADGLAVIGGVPTAPRLSADASMIAFECLDTSLIANDSNDAYDAFVRNLSAPGIELVSVRHPDLASVTPNRTSAISGFPASADARWIVFSSAASDLVTDDQNGVQDVFVRDLSTNTNLLVTANTNGLPAGFSEEPSISANGQFVAFTSEADDLVPGDTNQVRDVFIRDLNTGTTTLVSVSTNGVAPGNKESYSPVLSADGKFVLFRSRAFNLAPGPYTYTTYFGSENLFYRDLEKSKTYALSTEGIAAPWAMTPDARRVAFLARESATFFPLYVWDQPSGMRISTNRVISVAAVSLSADGRKLAYATNGVVGEVRLLDLENGEDRSVATLWAASRPGLRFSSDGQFLVFAASSVRDNGTNQVYIADLQAGTLLLVSKSYETGAPADGDSDSPVISSDDRFIAYRSEASNIVPNDNNGFSDVYIYDRLNGVTLLVSASHFGSRSADNRSLTPVFSPDGQNLLFTSWASNLVPGDFNGWADVFLFGIYSSSPIPLFSLTLVGNSRDCYFTWAALPGKAYRAQFKTALDAPQWQDLPGGVTIVGNQGYLKDFTPGVAQRFYRIVAY